MMRKAPKFDGKLTLKLKSSFDPTTMSRGKTPGLGGFERTKLDTILDSKRPLDLF